MRKRHQTAQVPHEKDSPAKIQIRRKTKESPNVRTQDSNPSENISCRIGDSACAAKHATVIQRTGLFHPMKARQKVQSLLRLQKRNGNRFVQRVIVPHLIQTKLQVGQTGDKYEQEANRAVKFLVAGEPQLPVRSATGIRIARQPDDTPAPKLPKMSAMSRGDF